VYSETAEFNNGFWMTVFEKVHLSLLWQQSFFFYSRHFRYSWLHLRITLFVYRLTILLFNSLITVMCPLSPHLLSRWCGQRHASCISKGSTSSCERYGSPLLSHRQKI